MFSKTPNLTGVIAVAAALYVLGSTMAWAQGQGGGPDKKPGGPGAETVCTGDQVLTGDGDCVDLTSNTSAADCPDGEVLLGGTDGCVDLQGLIDDLLEIYPRVGGFSAEELIEFLDTGGRFVFISSRTVKGDFGGVVEGEVICNLLAAAASLPGTYLPWLADSDVGSAPDMTFIRATGNYILVDGTLVADDWDDLVNVTGRDGPINLTEAGLFVFGNVGAWTNVLPDGSQETALDAGHCEDWTGTGGSGGNGLPGIVNDARWTNWQSPSCGGSQRLYCFGQ